MSVTQHGKQRALDMYYKRLTYTAVTLSIYKVVLQDNHALSLLQDSAKDERIGYKLI